MRGEGQSDVGPQAQYAHILWRLEEARFLETPEEHNLADLSETLTSRAMK